MPMIPNFHSHLELFETVPNERPDRMDQDRRLDIVAWLPRQDGRLVPLTVCGAPPLAPGAHYAILNTTDKSYTTLDGVRYVDYKAWRASWPAKPPETTAEPVKAAEPARGTDPTRQAPQAWFEPERIGR